MSETSASNTVAPGAAEMPERSRLSFDLDVDIDVAGTEPRGERGTDMFVVLEGNVTIYTGNEENTSETVIDLGDHQFTGELNMLNDQPTLVGARTTVPSVLLRVTRADLRRLMRAEGEIANLILQAFIWRRIGLASQTKVGVTLIGYEGEAETLKLQRFLRRNGYPHHVASVEAYKSSSALPSREADSWPAVVFSDGRVLHRPKVSKLADELGISELPDKSTIYGSGANSRVKTEIDRLVFVERPY